MTHTFENILESKQKSNNGGPEVKVIQNNNKDVEIGSYPFFQAGKLGVSLVIRSEDQLKIDKCSSEILEFVNQKKIEIVVR